MLKRIKIENLRGIREGELDGLTKLVVLVGPNGSGKSTVLEGTYIGGAQHPAAAVGLTALHRTHTWNGARWFIQGGTSDVDAVVEVEWYDGERIVRRVHWDASLRMPEALQRFNDVAAPGPFSAFRIHQDHPALPDDGKTGSFAVTAMAANNIHVAYEATWTTHAGPLRLVEPNSGQPLHDLFSRAVQSGRREGVVSLARDTIAGLQSVEILTEEGQPRLFLTFPSSAVPASLAGDGIQALLRIVFELSSPSGGTVLVEEPETHMHPRALSACAKAIVAATRRDVQVILTTHSLELIDRLLSELTDEEVEDMSMMTVLKVRLQDGRLTSISIPASDAEQARTSLDEDLR